MGRDVLETIEQWPVSSFTEKAYLDYSMTVILDRALPSMSDGLKPVQRRIIYAMSELGLDALAKHKKSARTVGDVLGKFHPHGDSACYEAMVLMAQSFSYRYPLIDGQGNWGSPDDPKSFAAMRYTEAKCSIYAELLLSELGHATVEWGLNFDGTLKEPKTLPARLPFVLLNGSQGIAVGMATDIPSHNMREVAEALAFLLMHPKASLEEIMGYIQGPDFPTAAQIITSSADITKMYATGVGSIRQRAVYREEKGDIIIEALPYQVSGSKILEQIAALMQAKKLPPLVDLRDESDHEHPTRLVLVTRSQKGDLSAMMAYLLANTDLEKSYRVNLNMIGLDGKPCVKPLLTILKEWLIYRERVVRARLQHRLDKIADRLHILEGFLIAYLNLDEIIAIIREQDDPKKVLMERFSLTERQAEGILDLKLRHLARLEEIALRKERNSLSDEKTSLEHLLSSEKALHRLIHQELLADAQKYGDARRSPLVEVTQQPAVVSLKPVSSDPVTVVLSEKGWIRAAKGHEVDAEKLSYKTEDRLLSLAMGWSHQSVVIVDSLGRSYSVAIEELPSARGFGDPLSRFIDPPSGAHFVGVLSGEPERACIVLSADGYGFSARVGDALCKNRKGKTFMKLPSEGQCVAVLSAPIGGDLAQEPCGQIALLSAAGHLLLLDPKTFPLLEKGRGLKMISLKKQDYLMAAAWIAPGAALCLQKEAQQWRIESKELLKYQGEKAGRGLAVKKDIRQALEQGTEQGRLFSV